MAQTRPQHITSLVGCLTLQAPLHIGSGRGDVRTDSLVMLDKEGVPYIPATSLTGILRAATCKLAEAAGDSTLATELWGRETTADTMTLSAIEVSDAVLQEPQYSLMKRGLEVREHVGLRRDRGVAQDGIKLDREVVPQGLKFWFELQLGELLDEGQRADQERLLNEVFALIGRRGGCIGGRTGTGLGEFTLELRREQTLDLGDANTLIGFLKCGADAREEVAEQSAAGGTGHQTCLPFPAAGRWPSVATATSQALTWCRIDLRLDVVEGWPLLVKSEVQYNDVNRQLKDTNGNNRNDAPDSGKVPEAVDANFVRTWDPTVGDDGDWVLTLPGSGLRGAFRSRAEKIIRTMGPEAAGCLAACDPTWSRQQRGEDGNPLLTPLLSCVERMRLGEISLEERCLACRLFGCSEFGGHVRVGEGVHAHCSSTPADEKLLDHVAIDRFTGGPVPNKKFTSRPLMKGSFRTSIILEDFAPWELGLIAYLLKDLHDADLRVGYGKAKGFGKVKGVVTGFRIEATNGSHLAAMMQEPVYGFQAESSGLVSAFEGLPRDFLRPAPTGPAFLPNLDTPLARLLTCCAHECDKRFQEATLNG